MSMTLSSLDFITQIIDSLEKEFSIKDLGTLRYFLGIHVSRFSDMIFLTQHQYIANLLHEANLANLKPARTPMEPKLNLHDTTSQN